MTELANRRIVLWLILTCNCITSSCQTRSSVGLGVSHTDTNLIANVQSFFVYNNKLIVSGEFNTAGTTHAEGVASWNGTQWDSVGLGLGTISSNVYAKNFCEWNGILYAGGTFNQGVSSGLPWPNEFVPYTEYLAKWDGTSWSAVSNASVNFLVYTVIIYNNELYVAGQFTQVGSLPVHRIAKWNGTNWNNVGGGVMGFGIIDCMAVYNGELYVGGDFGSAGGVQAQFIARWNGSNWNYVGSPLSALNAPPRTFVVDSINNVLYVGGPFTAAGGQPAFGAAKWDGNNWSALGNDTIIADDLEIYHNELYAASQYVYKWNGQSWMQMSTNHGNVFTLKTFNDSLYVGGEFDTLNGDPMSRIARYYSPNTTIINALNYKVYFSIYPNPVKKEITIELESANPAISGICIYSIEGKLEKEFDIKKLAATQNIMSLNVEALKTGIHFLELQDAEGRKLGSKKFVVD